MRCSSGRWPLTWIVLLDAIVESKGYTAKIRVDAVRRDLGAVRRRRLRHRTPRPRRLRRPRDAARGRGDRLDGLVTAAAARRRVLGTHRRVRLGRTKKCEIRRTRWYDRRRTVIVDVNPFVYSRPIAPEDILDRDAETHELLRNAVGGHYVRLYAPRKYGKTSLLKRALRDGERAGGADPGHRRPLPRQLARRRDDPLRARVRAAPEGPIREKVEELLQRTGLGLSLGAYGIGARLQIDPSGRAARGAARAARPADEAREERRLSRLIALDEFQDVDKIEDLDGLIRSHIQHQGEVASYVFAGSEPGLMKQLFENKERPALRLGRADAARRLDDADIADYVADTVRRAGDAPARRWAAARDGAGTSAAGDHARLSPLGAGPAGRAASLEHWELAHAAARAEVSRSSTRCGGATARRPTRKRCGRSSRATGRRSVKASSPARAREVDGRSAVKRLLGHGRHRGRRRAGSTGSSTRSTPSGSRGRRRRRGRLAELVDQVGDRVDDPRRRYGKRSASSRVVEARKHEHRVHARPRARR